MRETEREMENGEPLIEAHVAAPVDALQFWALEEIEAFVRVEETSWRWLCELRAGDPKDPAVQAAQRCDESLVILSATWDQSKRAAKYCKPT